jgi:cytochrome c-type biogenesis protein CcmH
MVTFWLLAILLFVLAIAFILYPFITQHFSDKKDSGGNNETTVDQRQTNIDIAKEQLQTLEEDFAKAEISQEEYDSLKYELESSLIEDISVSNTAETETKTKTSSTNPKLIMFLVILFVPLCSILFYQQLGTPGFIDGSALAQSQHSNTNNQPSVDEMIGMLINKLKKNPNDEKGWFLLARTFMALKKYDEAYKTYENLLKLTGEDADVLVSMADAAAMSKAGKISGEPEKLIRRALKIAPDNITGLWLIGIAEKEQGNNAQALKYWTKLYPLIEEKAAKETVAKMIQSVGGSVPQSESEHNHDNSVSAETMANIAAEINTFKSKAKSDSNTKVVITVTIDLSSELKNQANDNDVVFIYAKALQGPPMPLAAAKKKVAELPMTISLDDSMAMMPSMKISAFKEVRVGARISKSGQPGKNSGDLMSDEVIVDLSDIQAVNLIINKVVK